MQKKLWNKDYVLLLQGSVVSSIGDLMYSVAIGYWVYQQTGSNTLMGLMSSISMFVTMFLSPVCGSIVDKCSRKPLIVGIDVMQGLLMISVGLLAWQDALSVPLVLVAALLASFGSVFYAPAVSTLLLDIIPRNDMVRGQSIYSGTSSLISLVGRAFSGALVAFLGVPLIVLLNGLSNLYAAASELLVHVPRTVQQGTPVTFRSVVKDMGAAAKTVFSDTFLRLFVPSALILNLLGAGPSTLMLPFCLEKGFTVEMYGYLTAAITAASLVCVLVLGIVKLSPRMRFRVMAAGFVLGTVFFFLAYFSRSFPLLCAASFLGSLANCAGNTIFSAAMMLALPEENRSAILGFIQSASVGGCALSAVLYGMLGDMFPLYLVFAAGTFLTLAPMLYLCCHRKMKEFVLEHCQ